jgi:hypothetical protein
MNVNMKTLAVVSLSSLAVGANSFEVMPSADSAMHTEGRGPVTIARGRAR